MQLYYYIKMMLIYEFHLMHFISIFVIDYLNVLFLMHIFIDLLNDVLYIRY